MTSDLGNSSVKELDRLKKNKKLVASTSNLVDEPVALSPNFGGLTSESETKHPKFVTLQ